MLMKRSTFLISATLFAFLAVADEAPVPSFEAASIKPSKSAINGSRTKILPDGVAMEHILLGTIVKFAYSLADYQYSGPDAVSGPRYDIVTRSSTRATADELRLMMQALLSGRFKVESHWEERVLPAYLLEIGKKGPKLHRPSEDEKFRLDVNGPVITGNAVSMTQLAGLISRNVVKAPVLDMTNLDGKYDFSLNILAYADDVNQLQSTDMVGTINGALQAKLGLKLTHKKAPIKVLVVDHAEAPTEN
jgi:uncharacterized protein (TIGR03435 family)